MWQEVIDAKEGEISHRTFFYPEYEIACLLAMDKEITRFSQNAATFANFLRQVKIKPATP